jgi:hypothetical protein
MFGVPDYKYPNFLIIFKTMFNLLREKLKKESLVVVLLICISLLYFHFSLPKYLYQNYNAEITWDILSYYLYLPLIFLHNDLGIKDYSYIQHLFDQYHFSPTFYQASLTENGNGNYVMMYTMGLAILESPFFFIGHIWAKIGGYPQDGFSYPYQFSVSTGMMAYILGGVFILRKILLHFFTERVSAISLILLLLGTNYFREAVDYNLGPHAILFAIYSLLIYYTIKWHTEQRMKFALMMGLAIGFLTLSRPTEIICVLIPLLWNVYNKKTLLDKIRLIKTNWKQAIVLCCCVVLIGLPQMIYWKTLTGSWIYNSYWNQQSFDIHESHLMNILFSFRKGWFVYTPMIVFAFVGFFLLHKNKLKESQFAVYAFIVLNIFLISHVPVWWNAGSFGQRFMVQSYALLAIPLGAFVQFLTNKNVIVKFVFGTTFVLAIALNLFQTWQLVHWILPGDGITKAFYTRIFLKTSPLAAEDNALLEVQREFDPNQKFDNTDGSYKGRTIGFFDFDSLNTGYIEPGQLDTAIHRSGAHAFLCSPESAFTPVIIIPYSGITKNDHAWIRFTVWYYPVYDIKENGADVVIHFLHRDKPYQYVGYHLEDYPYELNKWNRLTVDYLTPSTFSDEDEMKAYVWFRGKQKLFIDDIHIQAFEKR